MTPKLVDFSREPINFPDALRRAYPSRPIVPVDAHMTPLQCQLLSIYGTVVQPSLTTRQPIRFTPRYMALAS